jgi:hypothetical protein
MRWSASCGSPCSSYRSGGVVAVRSASGPRPLRRGAGRVAGAAFAVALLLAGCGNGNANSGDTKPQNNTHDPSQGSPGATVGGTQGQQSNSGGQGSGTGTGRGSDTP